MNAPCCCSTHAVTLSPPRRTPLRRGIAALEWLAPACVLALMPKCPACVAAYVGMFTGLGISVSSAAQLRAAAIGLCLLSLVGLAVGRLNARWRIRREHTAG